MLELGGDPDGGPIRDGEFGRVRAQPVHRGRSKLVREMEVFRVGHGVVQMFGDVDCLTAAVDIGPGLGDLQGALGDVDEVMSRIGQPRRTGTIWSLH